MLDRLSIKVKVFIAPAIAIILLLAVTLIANIALKRQQNAFLGVVGGSLTTSTATTRLLLAVGELQSEVMRYTQLQQRLAPGDSVLVNLKRSIHERYGAAERLFEAVKRTSGSSESDAVSNISDFLNIHRAVSTRILESNATGTMTISTLMAHYQQLQSYIVELATRSLESAQATEVTTREYVGKLVWYLIFGSATAVVVAIIVTYYIGRAISQPILNMIGVMSTIAGGDSSVQVPGTERRDEIGAMARAVEVFAAVTKELRDREQSLTESRAMAEVASQHKSQFLANMSHELRTPLNAILGYTELIMDRIYGDLSPTLEEILERIDTNGRVLLRLINDVLDLSKIEAGQLSLSVVDYSFEEVVNSVVTAVASLAAEKQLSLKADIPGDLPPIRGDEQRIAQVLLNLVGNAIKFTEEGEVQIRASMSGDVLTVSVRDTGPGIAPENQAKIFEEFQQVDASSTRRKGGSGLGLAIAKRLVEMHKGRIWLESERGRGSTFFFSLPVQLEGATV
jgi:signal transduction histidine kinase